MLVDPDEHPSFYKLLFKEGFADKILMPPAFIKENKNMLSKTCLLKTDEGVVWEAKIVREKSDFFICKGDWPKFVEYHKLKLGNILFFFLIDKSTFQVLPYKQIRSRNLLGRQVFEELSSCSKEEEEEEEEDREREVEGEETPRKAKKRKRHAIQLSYNSVEESDDSSSGSKDGESPRYSHSVMPPKKIQPSRTEKQPSRGKGQTGPSQAAPPAKRKTAATMISFTDGSSSQSEEEGTDTSQAAVYAKIRRKKADDEARFSLPGSKDKLIAGKIKQSLNEEKKLSLNGLKDNFPVLLENIKKRGWMCFTESPGYYCEVLVWEFYAAYAAKSGKKREYLQSVLVRGTKVDCSSSKINSVYFKESPNKTNEYDERLRNKENEREWVVSAIAQRTLTPLWINPKHKIIKKDLNVEAKYWLNFVSCRLQPSKNETDIQTEKAILIASIMSGYPVNMGLIIFREIGDRARRERTSLPFPCLITALCKEAGFPAIPRRDRMVEASVDIDITRIKDQNDKEKTRSSTSVKVELIEI
ncbi:uncharacterized protein LOC132037300 isoform X2 [Lycium ferocissimum]|uniref:uncharacterized protein LOC132037300 isoform X2 n=1 Tax=Lycium ferocissimum TaxID=112874 RepID=UPI002814DC87|nr:uncharacterized protein LOC132037300 isoform X2 [Lycium ferocissimum]